MAVRVAASINDRVGSREPCFGSRVLAFQFLFAFVNLSAQKQNSHLPLVSMRNVVPIQSRRNLIRHSGADCDRSDKLGCEAGLVCGKDNCGLFHEISKVTGFTATSDCCEGEC